MLSIRYVSVMMRIFYIDWQQHWEYERTMNICVNAHGERTVSTKQPQVTDLTSVSPIQTLTLAGFLFLAQFVRCDRNEKGARGSYLNRTRPPLTVGLPVTSERYWASFKSITVSQSDTVRPLFLLPHMYLLFEISPGWLQDWRGFFNLDLVGEHSAPMYLLFAPYTDL